LPGANDLTGIGADRRYDTIIIRPQIGITKIFAGLDLLGAGRVELSLRGFEGLSA
jgi:hypothetical protein